MLLQGFVQYSSNNSCVIAVKLFFIRLVSVHEVHLYCGMDTTAMTLTQTLPYIYIYIYIYIYLNKLLMVQNLLMAEKT